MFPLHSLPWLPLKKVIRSMEDDALPYYAITSKRASKIVRASFCNVGQPFALQVTVAGDKINLDIARRVEGKRLDSWQWFWLMNLGRGDITGIFRICFLLVDRCIYAFTNLEFCLYAEVENQQLYEGLLENLVFRNIALTYVRSAMAFGVPETESFLRAEAYKNLLLLTPSPTYVYLDHRIRGELDGRVNVQASKEIEILSAGWMTLENFLDLVVCDTVRLEITNLTSNNMCQFLERWATSAESKTTEATVGILNANMAELRGNLRVLDVGDAVQVGGVERTIPENVYDFPFFCIQRNSDGVVAQIGIQRDGTVTLVTASEWHLFEPLPGEEIEEEEEEEEFEEDQMVDNAEGGEDGGVGHGGIEDEDFEGEEEAEQEEEDGLDDEEVEDEEYEDVEGIEDEEEIENEEVEEDQMEENVDDEN